MVYGNLTKENIIKQQKDGLLCVGDEGNSGAILLFCMRITALYSIIVL